MSDDCCVWCQQPLVKCADHPAECGDVRDCKGAFEHPSGGRCPKRGQLVLHRSMYKKKEAAP